MPEPAGTGDGGRQPTNGSTPSFLPSMSPTAKLILYVIGQTANGLLMFNAFPPRVVLVDGVPTAVPTGPAIACSVIIFVLGTLGLVFKRS